MFRGFWPLTLLPRLQEPAHQLVSTHGASVLTFRTANIKASMALLTDLLGADSAQRLVQAHPRALRSDLTPFTQEDPAVLEMLKLVVQYHPSLLDESPQDLLAGMPPLILRPGRGAKCTAFFGFYCVFTAYFFVGFFFCVAVTGPQYSMFLFSLSFLRKTDSVAFSFLALC